jgi:hypothetical protein
VTPPYSRRLLLALVPLALMLGAAGAVIYFIWWDATHCVLCRWRLDPFGRCPNPRCSLGRLTAEAGPETAGQP